MANKTTSSIKRHVQRMDVALRATYETEAIARHLNASLPTDQPEYQHLRALVVRIFNLNSVVMSALDNDDGRSTSEMLRVIEGIASIESH